MEDTTLWLDSALDIASETLANGVTVESARLSRALLRLDQEHRDLNIAAKKFLDSLKGKRGAILGGLSFVALEELRQKVKVEP